MTTAEERTEIREMIHGALAGYNARVESLVESTNASLNKIEKHLEKLNGSVAKHENILCGEDAVKKDEEKRKKETHERNVRRLMIGSLVVAILASLTSAYFGFKSKVQSTTNTTKIEQLGEPVIIEDTRGKYVIQYPYNKILDTISD